MPSLSKVTRRPRGTALWRMIVQLLCGIPNSSSPPTDHVFFEKTVLQRKFVTNSFKSASAWRTPLTSPRSLEPHRCAGLRLVARFHKLLSTTCNYRPGDAPSPVKAAMLFGEADPRSGNSPQPYTACVLREYPEPFSPPGRSCSLISVSSSPFGTTMSQKSAPLCNYAQFIPKALTSDTQQTSLTPHIVEKHNVLGWMSRRHLWARGSRSRVGCSKAARA